LLVFFSRKNMIDRKCPYDVQSFDGDNFAKLSRMNTETRTTGRRVPARYSAEDRVKLIKEHAESGLTKKEFCKEHGINLGTFYAWAKKRKKNLPATVQFAEVDVPVMPSAVEVLLPNGARVGIRHTGSRNELVSLVRGVAGC